MVNPAHSRIKSRWIIVLSITLLALISLIATLNHHDKTQQLSRVLLPAEQARTIDIVTKNELITLAYDQGNWQVTHPIDAPASKQRIMAILSLLRLPSTTNYAIDEVNLQELGLAPPLASVKINAIEFSFGQPTTDNTQRYLRVADSVYLVDDIVYPLINAGVEALADNADSDRSTSTATQ